MISKELLGEVLGKYISECGLYSDNEIVYDMNVSEKYFDREYINVYELAHKCKEWALNRNRMIYSFPFKHFNGKLLWNSEVRFNNTIHHATFKGYTEPEAIFKACEWILNDNKG